MSNIQFGKLPLQSCIGKTYFIGDIHSEADKLMSLLDQVQEDFTLDDRMVFLGDLFDRGLFSALTVKVLVELNRTYPGQIFFVRGNHDWMLQHYLSTGRHDWMQYLEGTLLDFQKVWGLSDILPDTIMTALIANGFDEISTKFLPYYETEEIIGTHCPFDPMTVYMHAGPACADYITDFANKGQDPTFEYLLDKLDTMWEFSSEDLEVKGMDKFLICGHQPSYGKHPRIFKTRAFIDTGCGKGDRPVTALIYPSKKYLQSLF